MKNCSEVELDIENLKNDDNDDSDEPSNKLFDISDEEYIYILRWYYFFIFIFFYVMYILVQ